MSTGSIFKRRPSALPEAQQPCEVPLSDPRHVRSRVLHGSLRDRGSEHKGQSRPSLLFNVLPTVRFPCPSCCAFCLFLGASEREVQRCDRMWGRFISAWRPWVCKRPCFSYAWLFGFQVDFDSQSTVTAERQTFYCVPIPGENAWVKEISFPASSLMVLMFLFFINQPFFVLFSNCNKATHIIHIIRHNSDRNKEKRFKHHSLKVRRETNKSGGFLTNPIKHYTFSGQKYELIE